MNNPVCCGEESKWVEINHRLQYFYCEKCKKEVAKPEVKDEEYTPAWGFLDSGHAYLVKNLSTPRQGWRPTPLDPSEGAMVDNFWECHQFISSHHVWHSLNDFNSNTPCKCGKRVQK